MNVYEERPELNNDEFEEILNDLYGNVSVCGWEYPSGQVLREVDPIAFECDKNDYEDGLDSFWVCGECGTQHNYEDEAEDCCAESDEDE